MSIPGAVHKASQLFCILLLIWENEIRQLWLSDFMVQGVVVGVSVGGARVGVSVGTSGTGVLVGGAAVGGSLVGGTAVGGKGVTLGVSVDSGVGVGRLRVKETRFSA